MNKYFFLLLSLFALIQLHAQTPERNQTYFTAAITAGNYYGIDIHANYLLNGKYAFKAGYSGHLRAPEAAPYDYSTGLIGAMSFGFNIPYDKLGNYHVMAGRIFNFNKKGSIRVNLSFGVGLVSIKEPTNWERAERGLIFKNYTYDYNKYHTIGFIVNPKIEFPFTRYYGLTISPMIQVNKDRRYIGIGIGQMLGALRKDSNPDPAVEVSQ